MAVDGACTCSGSKLLPQILESYCNSDKWKQCSAYKVIFKSQQKHYLTSIVK